MAGETPQDGDIETYLSFNLKILSYVGFDIRLRKNSIDKRITFLKKIPAFLVLILEVYAAATQVLVIGESIRDHNYFKATRVTSHILSNMLCFSKGCRIVTTIKELSTVLQELAVVWRKYVPRHEIRDEVLKKASRTLSFCKVFMLVTFSGALCFGLPALKKSMLLYLHRHVANYTIDYDERVFILKYPFEIKDPMTFFYVVLEEELLLVGSSLFWIWADTFFAHLTTHASLQFQILRHDVDSLVNDESSDIELKNKFVTLILRHTELLRICERIEHIYSPVVLVTVLVSSINICFNIFQFSQTINTGQYATAFIHGFLLTITLLEVLFYCVFAEALTEQSSSIADAIYNTKWPERDSKFRVCVQMLIIKCQNPFYCTAYGFFPIGHQRLTLVLNTAFSYYMILRATT